jgi:phosphate transport system substrate-binding protein
MRMTPCVAALLALAPALAGAEVVYGGSSTFAETVLQGGAAQAFEAKSGAKLRVEDVSTGKALKALAEGKLAVVGAGRVLTPDEKKAGLLGTTVGYDGIALYVHQSNPVKELGAQQLKDLFTGKVTSWKALGGKELAPVLFVEPLASKRATVQFVQEAVLGGASFAPGIRELEHKHDQLAAVAKNEAGACFASLGLILSLPPELRANVRMISLDGTAPNAANVRSGAYPLSRPMQVVTKGLPTGEVKAFVDYLLSKDGQAIVERYFVPLKR